MTKYTQEILTALRLIRKKGTTIPLKRYTQAVDTVAGEETWKADFTDQRGAGENDEPSLHDLTCVVLPASKGTIEAFDIRVGPGTNIVTEFRFLLIAASGLEITPMPNDIVTIEGADWALKGATPLAPDGTPIIYKAAARKGA